jgi:quaternary ammonium compound-resistance protein SugE
MPWLFLFLAGLCEIAWAVGLKKYGLTATVGGLVTIVLMLLSFILLQRAMKALPLGTSYAVWTGIGALGTAMIGIFYFNEPRDWPRLLCIGLILLGIVGLKLMSPANAAS